METWKDVMKETKSKIHTIVRRHHKIWLCVRNRYMGMHKLPALYFK